MKVFKFGGASVKDAEGVINLGEILAKNSKDEMMVVVSAMGKTTNALETVLNEYVSGKDWKQPLESVFDAHLKTLNELTTQTSEAHEALDKIKAYSYAFLEQNESSDYDFLYDQVVSIGEVLATKIVASYLNQSDNESLKCDWMDARKLIRTNNNYRDAKVDWKISEEQTKEAWSKKANRIAVSQGFIGGGEHNRMTTLGREGSDFSAAIFAYCLDAKSVTIWKDVMGVLNADPKYFNNTILLHNISYREAVELSYFGASVIHPKTIKPLENKEIPLHVRSFLHPEEPGTLINKNTSEDSKIASYIFKENQVLLSISSRDFSFIVEEHMSDIFNRFAKHKLKINTMQNSAISFSVSVNDDRAKLKTLIDDLRADYAVLYNEGLELLTIRHFNEKIAEELAKGKEVLLQQRTRHTLRMLMRK
jgi:aspartate kinase